MYRLGPQRCGHAATDDNGVNSARREDDLGVSLNDERAHRGWSQIPNHSHPRVQCAKNTEESGSRIGPRTSVKLDDSPGVLVVLGSGLC